MDESDKENTLEPTDDSEPSSESNEQEQEYPENLSSESMSTVLASEYSGQETENPRNNDQDSEEIDQNELDKEVEKELEKGVEAISKYLEEEAEFINAYEGMMSAYEAEQLYNTQEAEVSHEDDSEQNEGLENEKEVEQGESSREMSDQGDFEEIQEEPELSKEDEYELENELEEPLVEQHQVEPFINKALETEPEPIVNEEEIEKLQEMVLEEQFETVRLNELVEELVEKQDTIHEELNDQEEIEEIESEANPKEVSSELEKELELSLVEQHQVKPFLEEVLELETEPEPMVNEEEIEKLQEMDLEEQYENVRSNDYIEELVEWKEEEDQNQEIEAETQEKENLEQAGEEKHQTTYLQEKLEEQEWNLELDYEEKDQLDQHQIEAAIEEELETEPEPIINEEKLEHIKNLEPEKQLEAELFYELIEDLLEKQEEEEKEEFNEKEELETLTKEEKVAEAMRELEITKETNSGDVEVEYNSEKIESAQEGVSPDDRTEELREKEDDIDPQQELEEILEQNRKIEQEVLVEIEQEEEESEKTEEEKYESAKKLYREQTGKRPIYANNETKGFKKWLEEKTISAEKEKEEQKKEQEKEKAWKWTLKNWILRALEIDPKLRSELLKLVEEFDELEKLVEKYSQLYGKAQREKLSQNEKNGLKSLIKALQKVDPTKIELFLGVREIKRYLEEQYYNYDFWDKQYVKRIRHHFFTLLSQKYLSLNKAQKKEKIDEMLKNWIVKSPEENISLELKMELIEIVENYDKLEKLSIKFMELYKKERLGQLSQTERKEFKSLIKSLKKLDSTNLLLFANIRAVKNYLFDFLGDQSGNMYMGRILNLYFKKKNNILQQRDNQLIQLISNTEKGLSTNAWGALRRSVWSEAAKFIKSRMNIFKPLEKIDSANKYNELTKLVLKNLNKKLQLSKQRLSQERIELLKKAIISIYLLSLDNPPSQAEIRRVSGFGGNYQVKQIRQHLQVALPASIKNRSLFDNPETQNRECSYCHEIKNYSHYTRRKQSGVLRKVCNQCRSERNSIRRFQKKILAFIYVTLKNNKFLNAEEFFEMLEKNGKFSTEVKCKKCGLDAHSLPSLELHHNDPNSKEIDFQDLVEKQIELIIKTLEGENVAILCSNCHRMYHATDFNEYKKEILDKEIVYSAEKEYSPALMKIINGHFTKRKVIERISNGKCSSCNEIGVNMLPALSLHHANPSKKTIQKPSNYLRSHRNVKEMVELMKKEECVAICGNCHRNQRSIRFFRNKNEILKKYLEL